MEHVIPAETEALMVAKLAASSEQLASLPPSAGKIHIHQSYMLHSVDDDVQTQYPSSPTL